MIKIYHNPRCRKSREGLQLLEKSGQEYEVILYLENNLSEKELTKLISQLGITPLTLVRKNEAVWKDNFKGKELTDNQIVKAMLTYPKLIERPIVLKDSKAVIGRPSDTIKTLLNL